MGLFLIFLLLIFIRRMTNFVDKDSEIALSNFKANQSIIPNYFSLVFHIVMAIVIIITILSIELLNTQQINILIADISFQFFSTILLIIIGFINPFTRFSFTTEQKLLEFGNQQNNNFITWLLKGNNYQITKSVLCLIVIFLFVYNNYLTIPKFNNGYFSNITIFLIFFYLLNSISQLIKNPKQFRNSNILRFNLLATSLKKTFFILIGTIVLVFIPSAIFNLGIDENVDPILIALMAYNVIMAINEFKVLRMIKEINQAAAVQVS